MAITITTAGFTPENSAASAGSTVMTTAASLTPTASRLMGCFVWVEADSGAWDTDPTLAGALATWTLLTKSKVSSFGADVCLYFFHGVDASPTTAQLVFTRGGAETFVRARLAVVDMAGADTGGTNGSAGFVAANTITHAAASGATDPWDVDYAQAFATGSAGLAGFGRFSGNAASAPRSGWTELTDGGFTGHISAALHWRADADTTAEATYGNSGAERVAIGLEIAAPAAGGAATHPGWLSSRGGWF